MISPNQVLKSQDEVLVSVSSAAGVVSALEPLAELKRVLKL